MRLSNQERLDHYSAGVPRNMMRNCLLQVALVFVVGCGGSEDSETASPPAPPEPSKVVAPEPVAPGREGSPRPKGREDNPPASGRNQDNSSRSAKEDEGQNIATLEGNFLRLDNSLSNQKYNPDMHLAFRNPGSVSGDEFRVISPEPQGNEPQPGDFTLPGNFSELPEHGYHSSGWPLRIKCNSDDSVMAYVPEGVFIQGKDGATEKVSPEHPVFVSAFYIDLYEVTNENFLRYRESLLDEGKRAPQTPMSENAAANMPVSGILWRDAQSYNEAIGKSLPTEAEWEKAARGAGGFDHPWGFGRPAWHKPRELTQITEPGMYPTDRSPYGVFDMAGNVKEWCADWYRADAYELALEADGTVPRNWEGPQSSEPPSTRVVKGNGPDWVVWHREGASLTTRDRLIGFRGVLRVSSIEGN